MARFKFLLVLILNGVFVLPLFSQGVNLVPVEDVYVDEQNPAINYNGQGLSLSIESTGPNIFRKDVCLKFDMYPGMQNINGNSLSLTVNGSIAVPNIDSVRVYVMTGSWSESSLTWSTALTLTGNLVGTYPASTGFNISLPNWLLQSWDSNPSTNFGIRLVAVQTQPVLQQAFYFDSENSLITNTPLLGIFCTLTVPPQAPIALLGPDTACYSASGGIAFYEVFPGIGAFNNYTYIYPAGWQINMAIDAYVEFDISSTSGDVCVFSSNSYGNSDTICKYVTVVTPGVYPGIINGPDTACGTDTLTFTLTPVTADSSWYWYVPNGWTLLSGQGTTTAVFVPGANAVSEMVIVRVDNFCHSGVVSYRPLFIFSPPTAPVITGQQNVFPMSVVDYTASSPLAGFYIWTLPTGASIVAHDTNYSHISILYGNVSGILCVQGINECAWGSTKCWPINVTTGINEASGAPGLSVVSENGLIAIRNQSMQNQRCYVFNETGASVMESFEVGAISEKQINIKPGFYFVRCNSELNSKTFKVCNIGR